MAASKHSIVGKYDGMRADYITVRQSRCAKARNRNVECLKCAAACTSGCISIVDDEVVVDSSKCVGCGTCATVCPTSCLESRSPSDAELLVSCADSATAGACRIACQPLLSLRDALANPSDFVEVACLGRVDESVLLYLISKGVESIELHSGDCACCAQKHGCDTARLVIDTANDLIDAYGAKAQVKLVQHETSGELCVNPRSFEGANADASAQPEFTLLRVMKDGTLPHFLPDRRERLLDALSVLGEGAPKRSLNNRLWGTVVIDGAKCSSCRMCATFCPTGAIRKFDDEDGTFGVLHFPGDCVKCASCRDVCPEGAILLLDEVKPGYITGERHRYVMHERDTVIDDPHQILSHMKHIIEGNLYER